MTAPLRAMPVLDAGKSKSFESPVGLGRAVEAWLDARRLFAVEWKGRVLVPTFQLDAAGQPLPVVGEILVRLPPDRTP